MDVRIAEENNPSKVIRLKLDDDGRISLEYLLSGFSGSIGLKFQHPAT